MGREGLGLMVTYRIPGVGDMAKFKCLIGVEAEGISIGCRSGGV